MPWEQFWMVSRETLPSWAMRYLPPGWISTSGWARPRSQVSLAAGVLSVTRQVSVTLSPTKQVFGGSVSSEGISERPRRKKKKKERVKQGMESLNATSYQPSE